MGTRADFYVGRGQDAEYLGSVSWDGYPDGFDTPFYHAVSETQYRAAVVSISEERDDWTDASEGWPWPWNTSRTSDYAYAFDEGKVYAAWNDYWWELTDSGACDPFNQLEENYDYDSPEYHEAKAELEKTLQRVDYPDMKDRAMSPEEQLNRSGLIVITSGPAGVNVVQTGKVNKD